MGFSVLILLCKIFLHYRFIPHVSKSKQENCRHQNENLERIIQKGMYIY